MLENKFSQLSNEMNWHYLIITFQLTTFFGEEGMGYVAVASKMPVCFDDIGHSG